MKNSSSHNGGKERRLIYFSPNGETPGGAEKLPDTVRAKLKELKDIVNDEAETQLEDLAVAWNDENISEQEINTTLETIATLNNAQEQALLVDSFKLAKALGSDGIKKVVELYRAHNSNNSTAFKNIVLAMSTEDRAALMAAGESPVFRLFETRLKAAVAAAAAQAKPGDKPKEGDPNAERASEVVQKISGALSKFAAALAPFLKMLASIMRQLKGIIRDFKDSMNYDPSILATEDRLIDKQIADPETEQKFILRHKEKTLTKINEIKAASDPSAIENQKQDVADLKAEKEVKVAAAFKEGGTSAKRKKTTEFDGYIKEAEAKLRGIEAKQRTGKSLMPILLDRLSRINDRLGLPGDDGLNGPSSKPKYVPPAAAVPPKTAQQIADEAKEAKEAAEKAEALKRAVASFGFLVSNIDANGLDDSVTKGMHTDLDKVLISMSGADRNAFFEELSIYGVDAPNVTHKIIIMESKSRCKVKHKADGALLFEMLDD